MTVRKSTKKFKWLIGIDEVGRGPVAGPVAVCVSAIPYDMSRKHSRKIKTFFSTKRSPKLRDSKRLTKIGREFWFDILKNAEKNSQVYLALAYSSANEIDERGIAVCIRSLIKKNLNKLKDKIKFDFDNVLVLLDGGLKAPLEYIHQETIIGGDDKEPIISFASIYAKVSRDALMIKNGQKKEFSVYGFEKHKGYGTRAHISVIKKYGISKLHRVSFLSSILENK